MVIQYKCSTFAAPYPRNWAPVGPTSMILPASPSPSTIGGIEASLCLFTRRHVTRVGAEHFLGGTIMRRPLCRQPRMAPPRASTMKLTRKLFIYITTASDNEIMLLNFFIKTTQKWNTTKVCKFLFLNLWMPPRPCITSLIFQTYFIGSEGFHMFVNNHPFCNALWCH